jgi:hypothetical protein
MSFAVPFGVAATTNGSSQHHPHPQPQPQPHPQQLAQPQQPNPPSQQHQQHQYPLSQAQQARHQQQQQQQQQQVLAQNQLAMNGINGANMSGHPMPTGPTPAGHQAELNYIYGMVEELSRQLADNRRVTEDIVNGLGRVRNRARTQNLSNDELVASAAPDLEGLCCNYKFAPKMKKETALLTGSSRCFQPRIKI